MVFKFFKNQSSVLKQTKKSKTKIPTPKVCGGFIVVVIINK